jgi:hypothetical protein
LETVLLHYSSCVHFELVRVSLSSIVRAIPSQCSFVSIEPKVCDETTNKLQAESEELREKNLIGVPCERTRNNNRGMKTCEMNSDTKIDSDCFKISSPKNETILALKFDNNKKIKFLPNDPGKTFPNLAEYWAYECSITKIWYENFKNLEKLEMLLLSGNQIEVIHDGTFRDMKSLETIEIGKEKN